MTRITTFLFLSLALLCSCGHGPEQTSDIKEAASVKDSLHYAKRFAIKKEKDYTILEIFGNKENKVVTSAFILYKNEKPATTSYNGKEAWYIHIPVKKVASMSSVYSMMLMELNEGNSIAAIDNVEYYNNESIQKRVNAGSIIELSKGPNMEIEKTLALKPDLLLTFGMGDPKADVDKKLLQANLPVAISLDHLEETPLARAEWIKFYACFFDKQAMADSLFGLTEKKYNAVKALVKNASTSRHGVTATGAKKPTVLTEIKYGDTWYVPSGISYMANLIADARGDYFWKNDLKTGSTPLSFEVVYAKAKDCDVWINTYNLNSKKELLAYDERYGLFNAFKQNRVYNNNKVQNAGGYSNYWETAMLHPDEVLEDLVAVFYPETFPGHVFKYYKKLE
jgi:iron complex transport system substrate-binding protein